MKNLLMRWNEYRPTKEHTFWTAATSVIVTLILGFGFGGWVTGGTAKKMADEASAGARHTLAAAVCEKEFMRAADARARLAKLQALDSWERDDHLVNGGWATMPGEKEADSAVAQLCATRLAEGAGKT
jgi:hypothetical protein